MFDTILNLLFFALVVYFLADAAIYFARVDGSLKQRLLASGRSSQIIISSRFVSSVGAGINLAVWLADVANAPKVSQAITTYLPPKWIATILIAVALKILRGRLSVQQHKGLQPRRFAAAGRSRAHNRTQPRQSPCSRRGPSQGPQVKPHRTQTRAVGI